ncbi:putative Tyrosine-protein phosphatase yvh1 (PTPase yvh1) [Phytophthora infestans]|uniref:Putative Tyrosine-protein phosphatase yvh1 (PTPase yvh1) n=1 Tax=Phytophthora infestans TaxID=4787 RepID=A0A8S9V9I4_PHYIN|nr:putative Tyrosine-protein phosphatase yvh1 (PTPase yvh1) [Phytophthora infestans]KAI9988440.1 hypothetical protein PInf_021852 [Phytophthora infestans]
MDASPGQMELQLEQQQDESSVTKFACKKCRCVLFKSDQLTPHEPEQHQISTRRKLKDLKHQVSAHVACSSYFLEETLPWMDEALLAEGKIHCPTFKCQSRLGALQWSGSQCSCGTWVTPSIKITKSRVDAVFKQSNLNIVTGVGLPNAAETPPDVK